MLSRHQVTCSADAGKLPYMVTKPYIDMSQSNLASASAQPWVMSQNIDFPLKWFRDNIDVSEHEVCNIGDMSRVLEVKFNEMLEFGAWLKKHPTYEFCGYYTEHYKHQHIPYVYTYSFNMAAYIKDGCNALDEFRTWSSAQARIPVNRELAALIKFKNYTDAERVARLPPKPKVTFGEALDLAKELGL